MLLFATFKTFSFQAFTPVNIHVIFIKYISKHVQGRQNIFYKIQE